MPDPIAWTSSDVVAFDIMQEAGNRVTGVLVPAIFEAESEAAKDAALEAISAHREEMRSINSRDRAAIDAHTERLRERADALRAARAMA